MKKSRFQHTQGSLKKVDISQEKGPCDQNILIFKKKINLYRGDGRDWLFVKGRV